MKAGSFVVFPTSVLHFGCSHMDIVGKEESKYRRRLFLYYDWPPTIVDTMGTTITVEGPTAEVTIPHDYTLTIHENLPTLRAAFLILSSPLMHGPDLESNDTPYWKLKDSETPRSSKA